MSTPKIKNDKQYQPHQKEGNNQDSHQLQQISQSLRLKTTYQRSRRIQNDKFFKQSVDTQDNQLRNSQNTLTKFDIFLKNKQNNFPKIRTNNQRYKESNIIQSNIKIIDQSCQESDVAVNIGQNTFITYNFKYSTPSNKNKVTKQDNQQDLKFNTDPKNIELQKNKKIFLPCSASPSKRKLIKFQQPKFKDDFSEDDTENYYLPSVENSLKKHNEIQLRSSSPLKRMSMQQNPMIQRRESIRKQLAIRNTKQNQQGADPISPNNHNNSTAVSHSRKESINPSNLIQEEETVGNQEKNQNKYQSILSSSDSKIINTETEFSDDIFRKQSQINIDYNQPQNKIKIQSNTDNTSNQRYRRDGIFCHKKQQYQIKSQDKLQQPSIKSPHSTQFTQKDIQFEQLPLSKFQLNENSYNEDSLNKQYLEEFIQVNKLFIQDNLELQVQTYRERIELYRKKSSSADIMVSVNLPEKTEVAINSYVDILRRNLKQQSNKADDIQHLKNSKKYLNKDFVWSPYDLILIIDDNLSKKSLQNIKKSLQFICNQSSQFDRVCLVFPCKSEITKSKLVMCDQFNKEYLEDIFSYIIPSGDIKTIELLEQAIEVLNNRQDRNFISQIFFFTEGQTRTSSQQMMSLLEKRTKDTFYLSVFQLNNSQFDSSVQLIAQQKQGDYHFIEDSNSLPFIAAKALGQLKTTVGFKGSAMIMPILGKDFIEKITLERKYGGDNIWKSDLDLQAQSIDMYNLIAGCSKSFNLKYSFPATRYLIGDEWVEKSVFKTACLVFFESEKYQQYIYNEQVKKITFENGDLYKTEQESIKNNPYNPVVLRNSFKYEIIDSLESLIMHLENNSNDFNILKFEENLNLIQQEYFLEIAMHFEEFLDEIQQITQSIKQQQNYINNNLSNKLTSFFNAHKYQKSQICKTQISFLTQISDYYMNYAQFYFQRICQQQQQSQ